MNHLLRLAPALALLTACGAVDTNIEPEVTLEQGIYGQALMGCDTWPCSGGYIVGDSAFAFDRHPFPTDGGTRPTPLASQATNARGVFELPLQPGAYFLSFGDVSEGLVRLWGAASEVSVPSGRVRRDFTSGAGGGSWSR